MAPFGWYGSEGIWMVWRNSGGICERKIPFWMKKEADQTGFKGTRTVRISRNHGAKNEEHIPDTAVCAPF